MLLRNFQWVVNHFVIFTDSLVFRWLASCCRLRGRKSCYKRNHRSNDNRSYAAQEQKVQKIHPDLHGGYYYSYLGSCSAMIFFYPLLETEILALVSLVSAYNSFFLIPLVPIMLELSCETAFPVGEGSAAGLLFAMGNFAGFVLGIFLSLIVQG